MTLWLVTRHAGTRAWAQEEGLDVAWVAHLETEAIAPGDFVVGNLPLALIAAVEQQGGIFLELQFETPAERRGSELTARELRRLGPRFVRWHVEWCGEVQSQELIRFSKR